MKIQKHKLNSFISKQTMFSPVILSIFSKCIGVFLLLILLAGPVHSQPGLEVQSTTNGVQVNSAGSNGVSIVTASNYGLGIFYAGDDGINIFQAINDGLHITTAGTNGVYVENADLHAIKIDDSGNDAIRIDDAGDDGIDIHGASDDGVYIEGVGNDGIHVNTATRWSMNIKGSKNVNGAETPEDHIAQIYNRSIGTGPDVLALKIGKTGDPNGDTQFITFFNGDDDYLGSVDGNGSGGVVYATSTGADYAECLPLMDRHESFQPGDLIGVHEGRISHQTDNAAQVMVITDRAAVLGNASKKEDGYFPVSFIGQVSVRVKGPVQAGDWIVPDGNNSGVAIAIPTSTLTPDHQIVGRAWESSTDQGIKRVNTAVGLDQSEALMQMIKLQQQQIDQLQQIVMTIKEGS